MDQDGGRWHQAVLTTIPGGGRGYQMYLDGKLVGTMDAHTAPDGQPDGGDPLLSTGPIVLCGRSDGEPTRCVRGGVGRTWMLTRHRAVGGF